MSFFNRPSLLIVSVMAAHILVLCLFLTSRTPVHKKSEPTPLVVNTIKLAPPPKPKLMPAVVAKSSPQKTIKKAKPRPKKRVTKKTVAKPDRRLAKLVQEAQDKLSKIDGKVKGKATPKQTQLAIDQSSYEEELAERIRLLLKLPEWGSVRLALTLDRHGKVCEVEILRAQSETNRDYVSHHLESTTLAPFNKQFRGEQTHTFTLTLNNEM